MICPSCGYEMRYPASLSFTPEHPARFYECVKCDWSGESLEIWNEPDAEPQPELEPDAARVLRASLWKITYENRMEEKRENSLVGC